MDKNTALQHSQKARNGDLESLRALLALFGVEPGTVEGEKALIPNANGDLSGLRILTLAAGGAFNADSGTAVATGGAATLNKMAGKITSEALTTAAAAAYTLTLTDSQIAAADLVFVSVANGTNSAGIPIVGRVTPAAGSVVILIENQHASVAFNGTVVISFFVVKA